MPTKARSVIVQVRILDPTHASLRNSTSRQNGNNPKVVQDLLRHSTYSITANIYDAAISDEKREAHRGVLHLVTRTQTRTPKETGTTAST